MLLKSAPIHALSAQEKLRGYALCGEPRCGSTYLARLCASTGVLGHPREYFAGLDRVRSANANPDQYLESWIEQTMTANGIYGLKIFSEQFELITKSRWAERLPNLTFIHLRRQDVLGQAISLVRARQSHAWESKHEVRRQPVYSRRSIATALERIALGQARWACWFARNDIEPLRLTYEDIAADPRRAVEFVAERLGIEASPPTEPPMAIQRDRLSEEWRERFVAESRDLSYFHNPWERLLPRIAKLRAHMR